MGSTSLHTRVTPNAHDDRGQGALSEGLGGAHWGRQGRLTSARQLSHNGAHTRLHPGELARHRDRQEFASPASVRPTRCSQLQSQSAVSARQRQVSTSR